MVIIYTRIIYTNFLGLVNMIEPTTEDCDFKGFLLQIKDDINQGIVMSIYRNLVDNQDTILKDIEIIHQSKLNFNLVVKSLGEIVKILIGAGV